MNVYLDMDGVLVDLVGGYTELTGMSLVDADKKHGHESPNVWNPVKQVDEF